MIFPDLSESYAKKTVWLGLLTFFFFYLCVFSYMNATFASVSNTASMELKYS